MGIAKNGKVVSLADFKNRKDGLLTRRNMPELPLLASRKLNFGIISTNKTANQYVADFDDKCAVDKELVGNNLNTRKLRAKYGGETEAISVIRSDEILKRFYQLLPKMKPALPLNIHQKLEEITKTHHLTEEFNMQLASSAIDAIFDYLMSIKKNMLPREQTVKIAKWLSRFEYASWLIGTPRTPEEQTTYETIYKLNIIAQQAGFLGVHIDIYSTEPPIAVTPVEERDKFISINFNALQLLSTLFSEEKEFAVVAFRASCEIYSRLHDSTNPIGTEIPSEERVKRADYMQAMREYVASIQNDEPSAGSITKESIELLACAGLLYTMLRGGKLDLNAKEARAWTSPIPYYWMDNQKDEVFAVMSRILE